MSNPKTRYTPSTNKQLNYLTIFHPVVIGLCLLFRKILIPAVRRSLIHKDFFSSISRF